MIKARVLVTIVIAQFLCTSLWFAGNAIMPDLISAFHFQPAQLGQLSSAVQFGFIAGTLTFAVFGIADRYSAVHVFFTCALSAAAVNFLICVLPMNLLYLSSLRGCTGFFLAGIYPVGMKIAADHSKTGLGKSLGFLVGALVLGTAFPHLLKGFALGLSWKYVIYITSCLAVAGGTAMLLFVPKITKQAASSSFSFKNIFEPFKNLKFRSAAIGYFGHMWELYAFWVFVPVMIGANLPRSAPDVNIPVLSFFVIAAGALSCVISGFLSARFGEKRIATLALTVSCLCCILSPLFLSVDSFSVRLIFLTVWGVAVIADSPLFSTLVAQHAPAEYKGTALTFVNCIGFSITILSIQLISTLINPGNTRYIFVLLGVGPVLGLIALLNKERVI
ncbi:MAG: MFS transporter [Bacteroidota bacterium]